MESVPKPVRTLDPVAATVEEQLRNMNSEGYGELVIDEGAHGIWVTFGSIIVRAENYEIALLRLARAIIDDTQLGLSFLKRLRGSLDLASYA